MSVAVDLPFPAVETVLPAPLPPPGAPPRRTAPPGRTARPRPARRPADAVVVRLHPPSPASIARPLRLTRRGVAVLAVLTAALSVLLVWVAWASRPAAAARAPAPATVTVRSGDTLWSIAGRVAPGRSPVAEVAQLQRLNHLTGSAGTALVPGQVLRTR